MIRSRYLSLVNILAGERLVPELMPWYGDVNRVAETAEAMLTDLPSLRRLREKLPELVRPLRAAGSAADNAAELVIRTMR